MARMMRRSERVRSQAEFCRLAESDVPALITILGDTTMPPQHLTFAAAAVSFATDWSDNLREALECVLKHPQAYVREGALLGFEPHMERDPKVRQILERVAEHDSEPLVREIAQEMLDD